MARDNAGQTRRTLLKQLGISVGAISLGSVGLAQAESNSENSHNNKIKHIKSFNPDNKKSVKQALMHANNIQDQTKLHSNLEELTTEQRSALLNASEIHKITGSVEKVEAGKEDAIQINPQYGWYTSNFRVKTIGWDVIGNVAIAFNHHMSFEFNGGQVRNIRNYKSVKTPGAFWSFEGVTTDVTRDYGTYGISTMKGQFDHCIGGQFGCAGSRNIGSRMTALRHGGANHKILKG